MATKKQQLDQKLGNLVNASSSKFSLAKQATGESLQTPSQPDNQLNQEPLTQVDDNKTLHPNSDLLASKQNVVGQGDSHLNATLMRLKLSDLDDNPYNARYAYDEAIIQERATSIGANGQIQPINVIPNPLKQGRYIIIDGHYRKKALQLLNKEYADAVIQSDPITDTQLYIQSFVSNNSRSSQTAYDNGVSWKELLDKKIFNTQEDLSNAIQVPRTTVTKVLAIMELPQECLDIIAQNPSKVSARAGYDLYCYYDLTKDVSDTLKVLNQLIESDTPLNIRRLIDKKALEAKKPSRNQSRKHTLSIGKTSVGTLKEWSSGRVTLEMNLNDVDKNKFLQHIAKFADLK